MNVTATFDYNTAGVTGDPRTVTDQLIRRSVRC